MKNLILLRHGKSGNVELGQDDFDRPLIEEGKLKSFELGQYLEEKDLIPDLIFCSSAQRTKDTHTHLIDGLGQDVETKFATNLYLAGTQKLFETIRSIPPSMQTVLMIGHNPGLHDLASILANTGDEGALRELSMKFPPSALAVFGHKENWDMVQKRTCDLEVFKP